MKNAILSVSAIILLAVWSFSDAQTIDADSHLPAETSDVARPVLTQTKAQDNINPRAQSPQNEINKERMRLLILNRNKH